MSDSMLKYQCPACGGALAYSATKQKLVCEFCESEFAEDVIKEKEPEANQDQKVKEKIDWNIEGYVKEHQQQDTQSGFICTSCGAEVVSDGNTVATECMYCGNPVVMKDNISGMVTPDMVIPFKIDKKKAEEMLREFYKGKLLLPNAFTEGNRISKITGLYVPFWLFSCTGKGSADYDAKIITTWKDGSHEYTKTEVYEVYREGNMGFDKIPVDASVKMEDDYMDGLEPYDYNELKPFDSMYMAGYFADKFDVSVHESSTRANTRAENSLEDALRSSAVGYTSVNLKKKSIQVHGEDINYVLLPVWILNTKYNGKMYKFAINGQTGLVSGELPIDKGKLLLWRIGIVAVSFLPITAIIGAIFLGGG